MGRRICCSFSALLLLLSSVACSVSSGADTLFRGRPLLDDRTTTLVSSGGSFRLGFFSPSGSTNRYVGIWYNNIPDQTVVWVANRRQPIASRSGNFSLTATGTLIVTDGETSATIWSSESPAAALRNPIARLLDNGNFVVREASSDDDDDTNNFAWQSFNFPTDTHLPGMTLGQKELSTGVILNINLTAWNSPTDPAPGQYILGFHTQGDPQLFIWTGTQPSWRGGPWNGRWFSGIPEVKDGSDGVINFKVDKDHITYWPIHQNSTIVRITLNSSGQVQLLVWIEAEERWSVSWYIPKDNCDRISPCGPNSYCSTNMSPLCTCLPAFHPSNQHNWDMLDGQNGCRRTTPLDCRNNTDGFFAQSGTKLPDTSRSSVNANLSLEDCRALCLSNCSCRAYAALDISGSGSGCLIWREDLTDITVYQSGLGQDLYVRLAAADLASASEALHHHSDRKILMIVVLPLSILFLACVADLIRRWKKRRPHSHYEDMELPLFDLSTIKDATDNFSLDNKLGEGGFGPVYKGKLGEEQEQEIAVKRLSKTSTQGVDEFKNEITLIAKLQHRNLVKLLGCCIQGEERLLIYEYMSNGSLDTFLFDEVQTVSLNWRARYNIILGVTRGLHYLHHDSRLRIIHRDLKASNILLDKDMNPKISDFGMARIFGGDESQSTTKRVVGTYGYMSPEYVIHGIFSIKSDVFSFGVLILEIISGKRNRDAGQSTTQLNLLGNMWIMWKEGKCLDLVDANFSHSFSENEVLRCVKVGLLCVQEQPGDRPTMSSVLAMMMSTDNISLLPEPKRPGFFSTISSSVNSDYSNTKSVSMNQATITEIAGR